MSEQQPKPPVDLGIYNRSNASSGFDPADKIAIAVSAIWLFGCFVFIAFVGLGDGDGLGPLRFLVVVLALVLPVAMIWLATIALKSARVLREESERLQASLDAMRQLYVNQAQMAGQATGHGVERKIEEIAQGQKRTESALTEFVTSRGAAPAPDADRAVAPPLATPAEPADQPDLALETPADAFGSPASTLDFIVALNFPETAEDRAGFDALRRALADRRAARLITASQDVLTLLSQDGIYMDDLSPDRARPEVWRRFAEGERGRAVAGLGGVRDRSCLALSSARMRQDSIFRDTAHHFLRTFDQTFSQVAQSLSDEEIVQLTNTRTARAFMLLGRVAGMFD